MPAPCCPDAIETVPQRGAVAAAAAPAVPGFVDRYLPALLTQAAHHVAGDFADVVRAHGLSVVEWRVLTTLADGDDVPVGLLARRAVTKQSTLTRLLDRMVQQGHVARVDDARDRRQTRVHVTDAGRALVQHLMPKAEAQQQRALEGFGTARRQALERLLRELLQSEASASASATPSASASASASASG